MRFTYSAVAVWFLNLGSSDAFSTSGLSTSPAFVARASSVASQSSVAHPTGCGCGSCAQTHRSGCNCPSCTGSRCAPGCGCPGCRSSTSLYSTPVDEAEPEAEAVADESVPPEIEAMDGIESADEAHNAERPARQQLKTKKRAPKTGTELKDLEIGSMVPGKVRSVTTYGAFVDIGAMSDGLLHISQLAAGFVDNVSDIIKEGDDVEVRVVSVDTDKNQIALSLLTEEEAEASKPEARPRRQNNQSQGRRDDSAALGKLVEKGWDTGVFVEGTVVNTADFGCFVRLDVSTLNPECEGEIDGLVHISTMATGRVESVKDVVSQNQKVQVRVKSIEGGKVSLTMLSVDQEEEVANARGGGEERGPRGALDWKDSLAKMNEDVPEFSNGPLVTDLR